MNVSHKVLQARVNQYRTNPRFARTASGEPNSHLQSSIDYLTEAADPQKFYAKEDKHLGNITPRIHACMDALNRHMNRGEGKEAVHHNADSGNPVTDMNANFPCPAFHPEGLGEYEDAVLIESLPELKMYFQFLLDQNFYVPRNPLWGDLTKLRSESFTTAQKNLFAARAAMGLRRS